ncbi:hypothetical protein NBE98_09615 [Clostridium swellfunianum]|uniref:hypothetical protein n=1 Tax=Clostridium swellfunianum TaxID=1367462 RepID=UPI00202FFA24|nr:hypothetical protein [Clostridium swellfunianum]MCM0648630.1 hypothetical protein [Clostridium swellfunianum]
MDIKDPYLAFCFDEAVELILMQQYVDEKGYLRWKNKPRWKETTSKNIAQNNNSELIAEMKKELKKYK